MELIDLGRFIISLLFVLGLILLIAWGIRKSGLEHKLQKMRKTERLAIVEAIHIDQKNKLVIVKRDDKEHLIMLGATGNLLIESITTNSKKS